MKLIQEYTIKVIIFTIVLSFVMEIFLLCLLYIRANIIFKESYQQTILNSETKSIKITQKISNHISNVIIKYLTDLKLIGKHALLLNGKKDKNYTTEINKESTFFKNSYNQKHLVIATKEELFKVDSIKKMFNDLNQSFDYFHQYELEFERIYEHNQILNSLFSNHPELNYISYYSPSKIESDYKLEIKFMMSIFKTIYIRRYIGKRANMDYLRFLILLKDELYIYPAESYNFINLYNFENIYPYPISDCQFSSNNITQKFPLCIYNFITTKLMTDEDNFLSVVYEQIQLDKIFSALCIKIPLIKNNTNQAVACIEIDFSLIFGSSNFNDPEKFEFGMITVDDTSIIPLFYNRKIGIDEFQEIFNDTVTEKFIIQRGNKSKEIFHLFHFLYYNLTIVAKEHPELKVNFTKIEEEYNIIITQIMDEIKIIKENNMTENIKFAFNKSICKKGLLINEYECYKDTFEMILVPLKLNIQKLNEDLIETIDEANGNINIYVFSIIATNPYSNNQIISSILRIKLERTIILFLFLTIIILSFFILIINLISEFSLNPMDKIIYELMKININDDSQKFNNLDNDKIFAPNKEMFELKKIYDTMRKTLIIKQVFNKEFFLDKYNLEFYNLVQDIDKRNIKEICNSYLGFYHYKSDAYNLAEKEFSSTLGFIQDNLNKITSGKTSEYEDKIKDAIKRSSTLSYINEYSEFKKIEENLLIIIYLNIFKQRFMYLYAMTKFKIGSSSNTNNINHNVSVLQNKKNIKKDKNKRIDYFKEAINHFTECKNINILLGINQIKVIYSLIMISKCYIQLNDYKNAINSINEALSLFFEFSKSFKDYHSKNYNPRIMLFVESNIFHYILFTIERICISFNRPFASNWIILKIFETSPFLLSNVHYHSAIYIHNYLERNKLKLNKAESKFLTNTALLNEYEKSKKYFSKIVPRINIKNINNKKIIAKNDKNIGDSNYSASYHNKTDSKTEKSNLSSIFKREVITSKISSSFHNKNKNLSKIITLCFSEKILEKVNGLELKDVIIKYFQKYFIMNESDKFSFIQFANNGKKTVYFKMEQLDYFLLKIQKTKNTFELADSFTHNSNIPFMELYNIFDSIIKNYPSTEDNITDNIIIMFINSDDIRFTSINECLSIVDKLNKKNTSVFLLTYDDEIKKDKINNIQSFLDGLFEGYFFQIKNYQQLKQIIINISTIKYQSNFFGYDYNCLDNEL